MTLAPFDALLSFGFRRFLEFLVTIQQQKRRDTAHSRRFASSFAHPYSQSVWSALYPGALFLLPEQIQFLFRLAATQWPCCPVHPQQRRPRRHWLRKHSTAFIHALSIINCSQIILYRNSQICLLDQ